LEPDDSSRNWVRSSISLLGDGSRIPVAAALSWTSVSVAELSRSKGAEWTNMRILHALAKAWFIRKKMLRELTVVEDPAVAPDKRARDPL
jgi:hypothetical protein